jgi:hypothetical protein
MELRFSLDARTGLPHIYKHEVSEAEVEEVLISMQEVRAGSQGSLVALGRTDAGRPLKVIFRQLTNSALVITAYELRGKPLAAFRRRQRQRGRR